MIEEEGRAKVSKICMGWLFVFGKNWSSLSSEKKGENITQINFCQFECITNEICQQIGIKQEIEKYYCNTELYPKSHY